MNAYYVQLLCSHCRGTFCHPNISYKTPLSIFCTFFQANGEANWLTGKLLSASQISSSMWLPGKQTLKIPTKREIYQNFCFYTNCCICPSSFFFFLKKNIVNLKYYEIISTLCSLKLKIRSFLCLTL